MEEYNRTQLVIGNEKLMLIKNTKILIVGVGGVGGAALEMLVRSGVENLTIIDCDKFEETNLNRQILCLKDNIGMVKVEAAKQRIQNINPNANVNCMNIKISDYIPDTLADIDYMIDACDDVKAKVTLIKYALKNNIKIISCCGTGNRIKPELLKVTNIWKTEYDPLAKKLRSMLRKENITYKLPVVSSIEQPIKTNGVVGSVATVPNSAGILLASYVINDIIGK